MSPRVLHLSLLLLGAVGAWAADTPVAVSPGDSSKLVLIGDTCPTFSWAEAEGAKGYELVVYRLGDEGEQARPVLRRDFRGSASGWTPALQRCLERGGRYAWSVRAIGLEKVTEWSAPALFQVTAGPGPAELEAALQVVRQYLATQGLSESVEPTGVGAAGTEPAAREDELEPGPTPKAVGATQLSIDGGVVAESFTGDGSTLTSLDPTNLSPGSAAIDISGTAANVTGVVALAKGGTGATDAAGARTNLGVAAGGHTVDTDTTCLDAGVTCLFAASTSEGGAATSGDSATGFFSQGRIEEARIDEKIARKDDFRSLHPSCLFGFRWVDNGNGTVTDCKTGLVWLKDVKCPDLANHGNAHWDEASQSAASLADGACSLSDFSEAGEWRLATKEEWEATLPEGVALGCTECVTNDLGTACESSGPTSLLNTGFLSAVHWTSSSLDATRAWRQLSCSLYEGTKAVDAGYVWPVRAGGGRAKGTIKVGTFPVGLLVDGETFSLNDGSSPVAVFEFEKNGDGVVPGNFPVDISGASSGGQVRDLITAAVNSSGILITADSIGGTNSVELNNHQIGEVGNQPIIETVLDKDFRVQGMSGGREPVP